MSRSGDMSSRGSYSNENVGRSSRKKRENRFHRMNEVSTALFVSCGLVEPKDNSNVLIRRATG